MNFKAICFDLDGTLIDSLEDIAESTNKVLNKRGFPIHPLDEFRYFVGDGSRSLVTRALPKKVRKKKLIEECQKDFEEIYRENWDRKTIPYKDISELLIKLEILKIKLAILSNKPHEFTLLTVRHFFPNCKFAFVLGRKEEIKKKPDPEGLFIISKKLQIPPKSFIFLGDSGADMQTAVASGCFPVGVSWGFRTEKELKKNGAQVILKNPLDMLQLLGI